jgi:3-oxoadipate enol-lactonase
VWCDTLPESPKGARNVWDQRINTVRAANSLAPLADATVERWLTDDFRAKHSGPHGSSPWAEGSRRQIRDTVIGTTPAGYLGCCAAILDFDFVPRLPEVRVPLLVVCGAEDAGTPASENRRLASLVPGARYQEIAASRHFPNVELPDRFNHIMMGWLDGYKRSQLSGAGREQPSARRPPGWRGAAAPCALPDPARGRARPAGAAPPRRRTSCRSTAIAA